MFSWERILIISLKIVNVYSAITKKFQLCRQVAEVTVDMSSLKSGSGSEDWYHLTGVTPIGEWGSLRLKIRYLHDLV